MDIAEDADDAGTPERHASGGSGSVERDIEGLAGEVGKGVVKEGIEIGKIHRAAQRNGHHVGLECLVLLFHFRVARRGRAGAGGPPVPAR